MVPGCSLSLSLSLSLSQQLKEIFRVTQTLHCLLANLRLELAALVTVPNKILTHEERFGLHPSFRISRVDRFQIKRSKHSVHWGKRKYACVLPRLLCRSSWIQWKQNSIFAQLHEAKPVYQSACF